MAQAFKSFCAVAGPLLLYCIAACNCCLLLCRMPAASAAHCLGANHGARNLEASQQQKGYQAMGLGRQLPHLRGLQRRSQHREARRLDLWVSWGSSQEGGGAGLVGRPALLHSRARPSTAHLSRGPLQVRRGDTWVKHHVTHAPSVTLLIAVWLHEHLGWADPLLACKDNSLHPLFSIMKYSSDLDFHMLHCLQAGTTACTCCSAT